MITYVRSGASFPACDLFHGMDIRKQKTTASWKACATFRFAAKEKIIKQFPGGKPHA